MTFPGHILDISWTSLEKIQDMSAKFPGHVQEVCMKFLRHFLIFSRNFLGKFLDVSGIFLGSFRENSRNFPGHVPRQISGNVPGIVLDKNQGYFLDFPGKCKIRECSGECSGNVKETFRDRVRAILGKCPGNAGKSRTFPGHVRKHSGKCPEHFRNMFGK